MSRVTILALLLASGRTAAAAPLIDEALAGIEKLAGDRETVRCKDTGEQMEWLRVEFELGRG